MRKILIAVTMLLTFGVNGFAERTIVLNKVDGVMGRLFFNPSMNAPEQPPGDVPSVILYAPLGFVATAKAVSDEGLSISVSSAVSFGPWRKTPYTPKESWNRLPSALKPIFKSLYQQAIEVDLSQ